MAEKSTKGRIVKKPNKMWFEIWRVIKPLSASTPFEGNASPRELITTPNGLSQECANIFGGGNYVALQVSESYEGYPLSHWVIKVRSLEMHNSLKVSLDKKRLDRIRQGYTQTYPNKKREAALTSQYLKDLEEPEEPESRKSPQAIRAEQLIELGLSRQQVIDDLIKDGAKYWPKHDAQGVARNAETTFDSVKRGIRKVNSPRKARNVKTPKQIGTGKK